MHSFKVIDKEGMVVNDISNIKKKSSTFHLDNKKSSLKAFHDVWLYPSLDSSHKVLTLYRK